jgi:hypothetical protein
MNEESGGNRQLIAAELPDEALSDEAIGPVRPNQKPGATRAGSCLDNPLLVVEPDVGDPRIEDVSASAMRSI